MNAAQSSAHQGYLANVSRAARELVRAVVPGRAVDAQRNARLREHRTILSIAKESSAFSPSLAQELRMIAGRD